MLRSVTTLKALAEMSRASTRLARTLPVMKVSMERWPSVELGITARSFTTERTFSTATRSAPPPCPAPPSPLPPPPHDLLDALALRRAGHFAGQQDLAVVAGDVDMGALAQGRNDA